MGKLMVVAILACVAGCMPDREVAQLRETQAVQDVELRDLRQRVRELELDMDRIAPHTVPAQVR